MAEFATPEELLAAARKVAEAGYKKIDAYSPFPVHGVDEAIGAKTILPWLIFGGGLFGGLNGFGMQVVRARRSTTRSTSPASRWIELAVVHADHLRADRAACASATAVFGMLFLNGLPQPYNPVFNVPGFDQASQDRFFLCIEASDPKFDLDRDLAVPGRPGAQVHHRSPVLKGSGCGSGTTPQTDARSPADRPSPARACWRSASS